MQNSRRVRAHLALTLATTLAITCGLLWPDGARAKTDFPQIAYTEFDLANGLHVILHEDRSTPVVAISVMYHVGSKDERPDRTGFAHFFEHLLFETTEHIEDGEFAKLIQNAGGTYNGNTTPDRTYYFEVLPSNQLELGLWLESERMFLARIEEDGVETQREVVKEERRQRVDNVPYGELVEIVQDRFFSVHPYRWPTIGSIDHLNAATIEEFEAFYRKYYVPDNAVLTIAGDIDPAKTRALVEKYFGEIARGDGEIPRPTAVEPPRAGEVRETIYGNVELPAVIYAFPAPAQNDPDFYALSMMVRLLAAGDSSRLNKIVRERDEQALFVTALTIPTEDPGVAGVAGVTALGVSASGLESAIERQIERIQSEPIDARELEKARNQVESDWVQQSAGMSGIASRLATYHMLYGDTALVNTQLERYLAVTAEDIQRVAKTYFAKERRLTIHYLPESRWKRIRNGALVAFRFVRELF